MKSVVNFSIMSCWVMSLLTSLFISCWVMSLLTSLFMSCWVMSVVTFSVHVMLGDVVVTVSVHVMLGEVCGNLLCSCHIGWNLWLPSLFMSCWVKSGVTFSVYVM